MTHRLTRIVTWVGQLGAAGAAANAADELERLARERAVISTLESRYARAGRLAAA